MSRLIEVHSACAELSHTVPVTEMLVAVLVTMISCSRVSGFSVSSSRSRTGDGRRTLPQTSALGIPFQSSQTLVLMATRYWPVVAYVLPVRERHVISAALAHSLSKRKNPHMQSSKSGRG